MQTIWKVEVPKSRCTLAAVQYMLNGNGLTRDVTVTQSGEAVGDG